MPAGQPEIERLKQELAICRSRYDNLLASSKDIVWLAESSGIVTYINSYWKEYTGLEITDSIGQCFLNSIHPKSREAWQAQIARIAHRETSWQISLRLEDKHKKYRTFGFEVKPIRDRTNRIVEWLGVGREIEATEELETESTEFREATSSKGGGSLTSEKEFVRALLENLSEGIVACDRQGVLTLFNKATQKFHGLPQEAIAAADWSEHYALYYSDGKTPMKPEDVPLFRALQGESVRNVEMVIKPKNAEMRYLLASGDPIITDTGKKLGAVTVMRDISERLAVERALKDSQTRFNGAFQQAAVGMAILSLKGRWLEVNPALCKIIGYTQEELNRTTFQAITHPEDLPRDLEYTRQLLTGAIASVTVEKRYIHKRGYPVWLKISTSIMRNERDEPLYFVSLFQDITQAKQTLQALEESEKRYRLIADNSSDLISIESSEGFYIYVSPAATEILGYRPEAMIGKSIYDFLHPEDALALKATANRDKLTDFYTHTYRVRHQDGGYIWLETTNRTIYRSDGKTIAEIVSVSRNVSDRKQAEAEITALNEQLEARVKQRTAQLEAADRQREVLLVQEREARTQAEVAQNQIELYSDIVKNIQIGIMVWQLKNLQDPESLQLVAVNPAAARLARCDMRQTKDCPMSACFPSLIKLKVPQACIEVIATQQARDLGEVSELNKCFSDLIFNVRAFPLPNRLVGLTLEDITHRKQAEIVLQTRATELTKLNTMLLKTTAELEKRNQELDRFAYVASHDLKAPLRAIFNLSEWLEEDLEDKLTDETRHQINLLRGRVRRMENLINGLLAYSRIGRSKAKPETIDVGSLLREIIGFLDVPSGFTIEIDDSTMPVIISERLPLQQVFTNLIGNAIAHHHRSDGKVSIAATDLGRAYRFSVSDDGPGISPDYHQKIFGIFQTLQARDCKEGTGIGLSIVKKAVEERGGTIEMESELGRGTTFYFTWRKTTD